MTTDPAQELAQQMMSVSTDINNLKDEIANDEMGLQAIEKTAPAYQAAELALNEKKANLAALQTQFDKLSAGPAEVKTEAPAAANTMQQTTCNGQRGVKRAHATVMQRLQHAASGAFAGSADTLPLQHACLHEALPTAPVLTNAA